MAMTAGEVLRDVFGYTALRPGQQEIIDLLIAGRHLLAVMPTGAGKSLCYQIPAILAERLSVVVSPLLALMDDQVAALEANGVEAVCIHSGQARDVQVTAWHRVCAGRVALLYLSPERLMTASMVEALQRLNPSMFAIDEAHCISRWGPNFRPEYERLAELPTLFPSSAIAAFTATADRATRTEIVDKLHRGQAHIFVYGFDRPNIRLAVVAKEDWKRQLSHFLVDKRDQSGIIYCLSRRLTDEVAAWLEHHGFNAIAYHAGLDAAQRRTRQDRFMSEAAVIMVATIAFGMGIDKPDIRYVCHLNMPGSLESYYQEIGRAGRDGAPAETLMLYGLDDIRMRRMFIEEDGDDAAHKLREHKRLDALLAYCEAAGCRRRTLLAYFDEESGACGNCDNCLAPPKVVDATQQAQMLLSAIWRTGQWFGGAHIINILRGADTQKIRERGHDRLPTHGVGRDYSRRYWQDFIRQAVAGGCLSIDIEHYGRLVLSPHGEAVLKGREPFMLREATAASAPIPSAVRRRPPTITGVNMELLAALKRRRLEMARRRKVPAYIIFSDATLSEMAARRPTTLAEMADINGVGPKKLAEFGALFLELTSGFGRP